MSKEAMKLALEALERVNAVNDDCYILAPSLADAVVNSITAIKEALMSVPDGAQPAVAEQHKQRSVREHLEPVAVVIASEYEDGSHAGNHLEWCGRNEANDFPVGTKFYTTPQQRTWVGLTDRDIEAIWGEDVSLMYSGHYDAVRAIEARLKEKNT